MTDLPTLTGLVPYKVEAAIKLLASGLAAVEQRVATPAVAPALTLDQIRQALSATGPTPLNIFQLIGSAGVAGGAVTIGTHAERLAVSPIQAGNGAVWYETDRTVWYGVILGVWTYLSGTMQGTLAPDLKPADLGIPDNKFVFYSTDFARDYYWNGAGWISVLNDQTFIYYRDQAGVPIGFALCNGVATTRSTGTGLTAAYTPPDLITLNKFLRGAAAAGGVGGNATLHTHDVIIPDNVPRTVLVGADNTVAAQTVTSTVPSGVGGDDALPPYYEGVPMARL